ncbi:MAG: restriction endonuclease [Acidobacteria bacterium]|nr:restriction endonuclease [Acidobacteriota bacterium]
MNYWTQLSIEYANQKSYLDDLFQVYPLTPELSRKVDDAKWKQVELAFNQEDNEELFKAVLALDLFPIKDSYVGFFRQDKSAIERNPNTVARICGMLRQMGLDKILERSSQPKETNQQMGQLFRNWLKKGTLGVFPVNLKEFSAANENAILDGGDKVLKDFAKEHLGYSRNKGLDFVARFNGKYVIGEAKFVSSEGGNQNKSFDDADQTLIAEMAGNANAVKIAILDGVIYIKSRKKMYTAITSTHSELNVMSALVLRDFLYQL